MESSGMRMRMRIRMRGAAVGALVVALLWSGASTSASASVGGINIYWGQDGREASLKETCASGNFEMVMISYLMINGSGDTPELNVAGHPTYPLNDDIKSCQSSGVKVFLSLDGAVANEAHAEFLSSYLWDNFLGGEPESGSRPLGDAVVDGIDFGIYEASTEHWDDLVKTLAGLSTSTNKVYLSAAPQCPYPDAYLDDALQTGLFDYVWIQFFNNPTCEYVSDASNLLSAWNMWTTSVTTLQTRGFFLGLPAAPDFVGSGGFIEPEYLIAEVLPEIKASANYGGVALWTKYWDEQTNYSSIIKPYVNVSDDASAGNIGVYWGQTTAEASLSQTCATGNFEIVLVSYLMINGHGDTPELNVAGHPTSPLNDDIKSCQAGGVKVFLSLDGAVANEAHAQFLSSYLWENFLGGESESRPLGDAVFDGIDFGIYEASTEHWDDLVKAIANLTTSSSNKVYLSAAPQCPYRDAYLDDALQTGLFDYVWIQFFNNPTCEYLNGDASKLVNTWNQWIESSVETVQTRGFYLGLPASPDFVYSGGYIEPDVLVSDVLPQIQDSSKYGGVMLWTKYWDEKTNYSSIIKPDVVMMPSPGVSVPTLASA